MAGLQAQLLSQLSGALTLPAALRCLGYLRRMGAPHALSEPQLRVAFLRGRSAHLAAAEAALPRDTPVSYLLKYIELCRVHWYAQCTYDLGRGKHAELCTGTRRVRTWCVRALARAERSVPALAAVYYGHLYRFPTTTSTGLLRPPLPVYYGHLYRFPTATSTGVLWPPLPTPRYDATTQYRTLFASDESPHPPAAARAPFAPRRLAPAPTYARVLPRSADAPPGALLALRGDDGVTQLVAVPPSKAAGDAMTIQLVSCCLSRPDPEPSPTP